MAFTKTLFGIDQNKRLRMWQIEVEGNRYRSTSGLVDGEKVTSEWSLAFGKNIGRANATTDEEQAMRVAETLIRIRKEQGYYETPEEAVRGKTFFQCMLASRWDNIQSRLTIDEDHPVYVQRKLDGCRCIAFVDKLQTRTGKIWTAVPHIEAKLKPVFDKYPDLFLDGELYRHSSDEDNFSEIVSVIRKTKPTEQDLRKSAEMVQYWIYDLPSCPGTFSERFMELQRLFEEFHLDSSFVLVETYKCTSKAEVTRYLEQFVSEGYEGAIVRLDAPYESRRSKNLLKVKQFNDEEFPIIRIEEGRGNLSGKAGRVVVDVDGVEVAAGLKFSHEEAEQIWNNKDYYVGKKATIKYFGDKTPDGSLRFPKCIQIDRESYE